MPNQKQSYGEARGELVRDLCSVGGWRVKSEVRRRIDEVVKIALEGQMKEVMEEIKSGRCEVPPKPSIIRDGSEEQINQTLKWAGRFNYNKAIDDTLAALRIKGLI